MRKKFLFVSKTCSVPKGLSSINGGDKSRRSLLLEFGLKQEKQNKN